MSKPTIFSTFTVERVYPAPPSRVFSALSDPVKKRRWYAEGEGFVVDSYSLDFRVGGFERTRFRPVGGPDMTNDGVYLEILPEERVVFAYSMTIAGQPLSSSLGTMELRREGDGTRLRYTEQIAHTSGIDATADRIQGTEELFEVLGKELETHP
ncbi:MAG: hypothetical protein B6A08_03125 [Sorangiineae bacterium NIC37A_2]|jgi:uncharacterized protein YndB with AHSA1/START domain|nr:MAG: hypothetical protein B6A08_03125 [Sorangiineae bacterium NIC37A_2]